MPPSAAEHIIAETAAGNRRIHEWPDQGWREGMFSFLPWLYLIGVAALIGHLTGITGDAIGWPYWPICLSTILLTMPYLVLSMMETGAWYLPFSGPVAISIFRNGRDWLMCYLLIGSLFAGWGWVWWHGIAWSPFLIPLATGWIWGAIFLISARILGRLAWRINQDQPMDHE